MTARNDLECEILEALADAGPLYVVDLAADIDEHPLTVENACGRLRGDGEIRSIGCQRYDITGTGCARLAERNQLAGGSDGRSRREGWT
ncbi:MarR family transcriptional regulator [Natrinema sp. 1APR25-10V2]|uniref:MarR family transcriptional regulator n=1 Tax=Natrinema sp. 1APR25-10V2 TaxID=2951081 RepID=UPI0028764DE5|nr:MarR family transcriptional regulator [Natrinema sp. 1APR25-10V2]MDS0477943.1 MarR family transcriptional regulator [Natrinema sp. 1APR25-10V2]